MAIEFGRVRCKLERTNGAVDQLQPTKPNKNTYVRLQSRQGIQLMIYWEEYSESIVSTSKQQRADCVCTVARFINIMRPELKGLLWPNQLKKGLSDLLKDGMLEFIVKQLPLIVSKSEDKWAIRAYWCLKYPALLAQMLTERSILDGSFEDSMHFSYLQECIVVVYGIDKADKDTGASLRVGNRRGGNSSKHTQLLAATENAAETYVNLRETFMSSKYPLRGYLQQLTYDYYHMLVIRIGMK
eukprot:scaffold42936_cov6096-Skeletonema_marinoi.AAC.1